MPVSAIRGMSAQARGLRSWRGARFALLPVVLIALLAAGCAIDPELTEEERNATNETERAEASAKAKRDGNELKTKRLEAKELLFDTFTDYQQAPTADETEGNTRLNTINDLEAQYRAAARECYDHPRCFFSCAFPRCDEDLENKLRLTLDEDLEEIAVWRAKCETGDVC